jgi:hypothetical protein
MLTGNRSMGVSMGRRDHRDAYGRLLGYSETRDQKGEATAALVIIAVSIFGAFFVQIIAVIAVAVVGIGLLRLLGYLGIRGTFVIFALVALGIAGLAVLGSFLPTPNDKAVRSFPSPVPYNSSPVSINHDQSNPQSTVSPQDNGGDPGTAAPNGQELNSEADKDYGELALVDPSNEPALRNAIAKAFASDSGMDWKSETSEFSGSVVIGATQTYPDSRVCRSFGYTVVRAESVWKSPLHYACKSGAGEWDLNARF